MAVIKCKMCGGDMELSPDKSFGTCEYCGSTMTLPKIDDEQRVAAFNRGNHFRRQGEFDKALLVYERIIQEDEKNAEAHWCCALCRFGIEYVQDPVSGEYLPTCHRTSFDNFLEDVDYLAALEYADAVTRNQYQQDGEKIAAVQRRILTTVQRESPFDVFLCYKESDENGQRTVDSTLAQDIYYQLTEQGRRVFFARITLEDKAGQEYEPYIFAALHSAKVMVVVGTKPEYLNAVWVKNEWSRYLTLMKNDRKRLLIPCYRDMNPYDLPEQLSVLQSYDMGKIGFIQDLIRGIAKVLDVDKPKTPIVKETVISREGGSNLDALLKRGNIALEDKEWEKADEFFNRVLDIDAECAEAYFGKALANQTCSNGEELVSQILGMGNVDRETLEACSEDTGRLQAILDKYKIPGYLEDTVILSLFRRFSRTYTSTAAFWRKKLAMGEEYFRDDKLMSRASLYAKGPLMEQIQSMHDEIVHLAQKNLCAAEEIEQECVKKIKEEYIVFLDEAEKETVALYTKAQKKKVQDASRKKRIIGFTGIISGIIVTAILVNQMVIVPLSQYKVAEHLLAEGDYDGATTAFGALGNYKDAGSRVFQTQYAKAETILLEEKYDDAIMIFESLGDYEDSRERVLETKYAKAEALLKSKNYDESIAVFESLVDFDNAAERVFEVKYTQAEEILATGDLKSAAIMFGAIIDYERARNQAEQLWNKIAPNKAISAGYTHTVGLNTDATVVAIGEKKKGQCTVEDWRNIVAISAGNQYTVGLKMDGTVVATGANLDNQCEVDNWEKIVAVSAGENHTVGLNADGTVVAIGSNNGGQCEVDSWKNITEISAGSTHTVGLRENGTVIAAGGKKPASWPFGQCNVSGWNDIVDISAGYWHTVGLRKDGTVVATGYNENGQCNVSGWTDIVMVSAGNYHTIGLKSDGTVIATGTNEYGQCNVEEWTGIVAIAAGENHTVALKSDGTVIAAGNNDSGQCNVSNWTKIKTPG